MTGGQTFECPVCHMSRQTIGSASEEVLTYSPDMHCSPMVSAATACMATLGLGEPGPLAPRR